VAVPLSAQGRGTQADTSATAIAAAATAAAVALANEHARFAGLSFARATSMERIAHALPSGDKRVVVLHRLAAMHATRAYDLMRDDAAGESWLPAQAVLFDIVRR
jgi:hypothetical protein